MKTNNILLIALLLSKVFLLSIIAQQTPVFADYTYNSIIINPAHAGFYENTDITLANRGHLNNIEGSPKNIALTVNIPTNSKNVGLGGAIFNDRIGITNTTGFLAAYSYKLFFNSNRHTWWDYNPHVLSFGITGGFNIYDENLLALGIQNDPNFQNNINTVIPTIGIGVFYNREKMYIGLSATNLLGNSLSSEENINIDSPLYLLAGYRFYTTIFEDIMINPSILIKQTSGTPIQADFNTKLNFKNKYEIGIGYRTNSSLNFLIGFNITNNYRISYNYNKAIKNTLMSTHGVVLNIRLKNGFKTK